MKIKFLGAAKTVTGSCYLVESSSNKFLIDCGLFQGIDVYELNYQDFDFDPAEIDFVILTHAHMDHCGLLPKLSKYGFSGKVYATPQTTQLSEVLLLDAAKIQELNSEKSKFNSVPKEALYNTYDALEVFSFFESVNLGEIKELSNGIRFKFINAGHILGAASVLLEVDGNRIVFSGDIGRQEEAIIKPFETDDKFDPHFIVMESLYGGITHQSRKEAQNQLLEIINNTVKNNGNVIIPSFAVQKTQELLLILKNAFDKNLIPDDVEVFLDSPLAIRATSLYEQNITSFGEEGIKEMGFDELNNIFRFKNLKLLRSHKQSLKSSAKKRAIFIAGSGMVEGGRIIRHLIHNISNPNNSVVFVGYQAEGTKGRQILEGEKEIELDKKRLKVNAKIERIEGFSSHADENDLLKWVNGYNNSSLEKVILTHADIERSSALKETFEGIGIKSYIPSLKEELDLSNE